MVPLGVVAPLATGLLNRHPEDAGRLADNQAAYNAGLSGQQYVGWDPVQFLGVRGNVLPSPDGLTHAWATPTATDDARQKYFDLLARRTAGGTGAAVPTGTDLSIKAEAAKVSGFTLVVVGIVAALGFMFLWPHIKGG